MKDEDLQELHEDEIELQIRGYGRANVDTLIEEAVEPWRKVVQSLTTMANMGHYDDETPMGTERMMDLRLALMLADARPLPPHMQERVERIRRTATWAESSYVPLPVEGVPAGPHAPGVWLMEDANQRACLVFVSADVSLWYEAHRIVPGGCVPESGRVPWHTLLQPIAPLQWVGYLEGGQRRYTVDRDAEAARGIGHYRPRDMPNHHR